MNKIVDAISPETMESLIQYTWPGNVRELQNVIERCVVIHQRGEFTVKKCCLSGQPLHRGTARQSLRRSAIEDRTLIDSALAEAGGECLDRPARPPCSAFRHPLSNQRSDR
jgi:DNA-binding NtrC family response regulator